MAGVVAGATAAVGGVGFGLWGYNRGNYEMDQKLHYARFVSVNNQAIAATNMYRQDIGDLSTLTGQRLVQYIDNACIGFHILTALFCPGRLGLHESPPPSWLCSLYMTNEGASYLWLVVAFWLGIQATLRCDTAQTHLLTRFVRLPVPSCAQIDRARKTFQSYEEVPFSETFRVPMLMREGRGRSGVPAESNAVNQMDAEAETRARKEQDVPGWNRRERQIDHSYVRESLQRDANMPTITFEGKDTQPEHFNVYRELQQEWWPYDIYCRAAFLFAHLHFLLGWSFYITGHHFCQVRALWAGYLPVITIAVLMEIYLILDIKPKNGPPLERLGPIGPIFAYIAMSFEYSRYFADFTIPLSFIFAYLAYICQIVFTIWLYKATQPDQNAPMQADVPGCTAGWWPKEWQVPSAFNHASWFVAPPLKQEPGVTDLPGELRRIAEANGVTATGPSLAQEDAKYQQRFASQSNAWRIVSTGLIGILAAWGWCVLGVTVDLITQGTDFPSLLSAPGLPHQSRDPRYRPAKPGFKHPQEVGTGKEHHRRLEFEENATLLQHDLAFQMRAVLPQLQRMVEGMTAAADADNIGTDRSIVQAPVSWPPLFEPHALACAPSTELGGIAVLSRHGRGVMLPADLSRNSDPFKPQTFTLSGIAGHGSVRAASWDVMGLLLVTSSGEVLECPGDAPERGPWLCRSMPGEPLPLEKGEAVAVSRVGSLGDLRAAIAHSGEGVSLYHRSNGEAWLPGGQVRLDDAASLALDSDGVLVLSSTGAVDRLRLDGSVESLASPVGRSVGHHWRATCQGASSLLRLSLWQSPGSPERAPELLLSA